MAVTFNIWNANCVDILYISWGFVCLYEYFTYYFLGLGGKCRQSRNGNAFKSPAV